MKVLAKYFPAALALLCAVWLGSKTRMPTEPADAMHVHAFGELPVVYQGRVKPYDTLARNSLVIISDRQTFTDENGNRQPAIRWLLDAISGAEASFQHKVFRIEHPQLRDALGLEERSRFRYALDEFRDKIDVLFNAVRNAEQKKPDLRDVYDRKVMELWLKLDLYKRLSATHRMPPFHLIKTRDDIERLLKDYDELERASVPHPVPPMSEEQSWRPLMRAALTSAIETEPNPAIESLASILHAYAAQDVKAFNEGVAAHKELFNHNEFADVSFKKLYFEQFFHHFEPFYHCSLIYFLAFLLGCFAWLGWTRPFNRTAFWLIVLTLGVHTFALIARMKISGYPPVTNLYSSAIFIGWGCVILGVILELIYKLGVGNIVASVSGFCTLLIAHFLAGDGDTLEMMQAVLDTKFWLATHVTTVTLGYTATYVAGLIGLLYILCGVFTRRLTPDLEKSFARMIYGVVCFALLLSFVGTVLGGLWADDSWGRFWGWDPKENGALIIVLWNAIILHARWGGMVKARGIAVLSVFGNIVTSWSWFGVNQLGVGLHSYGFIDSVAFWLIVFVASQLTMIGIGMIPQRFWRSSPAFPSWTKMKSVSKNAGGASVEPAGI